MIKHFCDRCAIELPEKHSSETNVYKLGNFEVEARAYQKIIRTLPAESPGKESKTTEQRNFSMLCSKCVATVLGVVHETPKLDVSKLKIGPVEFISTESTIHISLPLSASKEDVKRLLEATISHWSAKER